MPETVQSSQGPSQGWEKRFVQLRIRIRSLRGDPHHVAMGMAVGVFVAFTPTIPFHTVLTIALAFLFKGSKPAALIGSWLNNPLTFPFFYYGSYKLGNILLGHAIPGHIPIDDMKALVALGWDVAVATVAGGALLGILPAIGAYYVTLTLFRRIQARRGSSCQSRSSSGNNPLAVGNTNEDKGTKARPGNRGN